MLLPLGWELLQTLLPPGRHPLPLGALLHLGQPILPHGPLLHPHRGRLTHLPGLNLPLGIHHRGRPHRVHGHPLRQIQLHGQLLPRGALLPRGRLQLLQPTPQHPPLPPRQMLKIPSKSAMMRKFLVR